MVREGRFREDLFMRLNVIQLRIPPLREHKDDIRTIADNWWFNKFRKHLTDEQAAALMTYDYPGNVRELLNVLERAVVFKMEDFSELMIEHQQMNAGLQEDTPEKSDVPDELDEVIRWHIKKVFQKYGQNVSKAAAALKITRNTLRKYLQIPI